jgi:hypothetical protein
MPALLGAATMRPTIVFEHVKSGIATIRRKPLIRSNKLFRFQSRVSHRLV